MVELHLLVVQSQAERYRTQSVPAQANTQKGPQGQTQAHSIIPDRVKVNSNPYTVYIYMITSLRQNTIPSISSSQ